MKMISEDFEKICDYFRQNVGGDACEKMDLCIEECSELIKEFSKYKRIQRKSEGRPLRDEVCNQEQIAEEMCHVLMTIVQISDMIGIDDVLIEKYAWRKYLEYSGGYDFGPDEYM